MCFMPLMSVSMGLREAVFCQMMPPGSGWGQRWAGAAGNRAPQSLGGGVRLLTWRLSSLSDTHKWSTPRVSGTVPGARDGHSACVLGKTMYIFGGYEQLVRLAGK